MCACAKLEDHIDVYIVGKEREGEEAETRRRDQMRARTKGTPNTSSREGFDKSRKGRRRVRCSTASDPGGKIRRRANNDREKFLSSPTGAKRGSPFATSSVFVKVTMLLLKVQSPSGMTTESDCRERGVGKRHPNRKPKHHAVPSRKSNTKDE
jgi:hypothetical protein